MIYNNLMDTQSFQTEVKRKLFHLTGLIYVAGLFTLPRRVFIISLAVLLIAEMTIEFIRLRNENIRSWWRTVFGKLMREHEFDRVSGVTWMTLGVLCTTLLLPDPRLAATALLYLIFGDAAASLAGKSILGPRWIDSPKRISGSVACFIVCLVIGFLVLRPVHGWHLVVIGALTATVFELNSWKINDNFLIPVASAIGFILTYKLLAV